MASLTRKYLGSYDDFFSLTELVDLVGSQSRAVEIARELLDNGYGATEVFLQDDDDPTTVEEITLGDRDELLEQLEQYEPTFKVDFDEVMQRDEDGTYQTLCRVTAQPYETSSTTENKAQTMIAALNYARNAGAITTPIS